MTVRKISLLFIAALSGLMAWGLLAWPDKASAATFIVTKTADTNDNVCDSDCSLREAVIASNSNPGDDVIMLPAGVYTLTRAGQGEENAATGDLDIKGNLILSGAAATASIVDGGGIDRVLHIFPSARVTIQGLTIQGGVLSGFTNDKDGAGIFSTGQLTVRESIVSSNLTSNRYGGGIAGTGFLTITDSLVTHNQSVEGGGVSFGGQWIVQGSSILSNTAVVSAGGVQNYGALTVTTSLIAGNFSRYGGGLVNYTTLKMVDATISGNTAADLGGGGDGGGLWNFSGRAELVSTVVVRNTAEHDGGGVYNSSESVLNVAAGSRIISNTAAFSGGGIYNAAGSMYSAEAKVEVNASSISGNTATGQGGGVFNYGVITLTATILNDNVSGSEGGGVAQLHWSADYQASLALLNSLILSNTAGAGGGGLYSAAFLTATNSTISGNRADLDGGGLLVTDTTSLNNVSLVSNTADDDSDGAGDGGGLYQFAGAVNLQNSIVALNVDRGGQASDCSGILTSQGYNLLQSISGCTLAGILTGNLVGLDPKLDALQNSGGQTPTHALQADSPAIDAGNTNGCTDSLGMPLWADQRGYIRPVDGDANGNPVCDIGAFEFYPQKLYLLIIAK